MSRLTGSSRLAVILLALLCLFTLGSSAQAASTGCLPASIKAKLNEIRSKFGPISIVSAHRSGARIAGSGRRSLHASCRAVDFHPPAGKYSQVVSYLRATHSGGVGTYSCGMNHVHIDNGGRVRFHHCVTASGTPVGKTFYASKRSSKRYAAKSSSRRYASAKSGKRYAYGAKKRGKGYAYSGGKKRVATVVTRPNLGLNTQGGSGRTRVASLR
ncbi:MAG: D-Ala-D-Ala carboxypeptidase family metallohydrolase [Hyphomicrobiaceae bacterium]|nr:D-Ala-D-Ala carboxypeptidase family metallohydrolase [Hyphomicrobiaceae bacterium]